MGWVWRISDERKTMACSFDVLRCRLHYLSPVSQTTSPRAWTMDIEPWVTCTGARLRRCWSSGWKAMEIRSFEKYKTPQKSSLLKRLPRAMDEWMMDQTRPKSCVTLRRSTSR
jgi:hypothetical protein